MLKHLIISIFFLSFFSNYIFGQKNFKPASIELINGARISGFIDYRNWEKNPKKISFKKKENDDEEEYTIENLSSFEVIGEDVYTKAEVWKDQQSIMLDKLLNYVEPPVSDIVFLRTVFKSDKIDLFELVDDKVHFFIKPENDTLQELMFKRLQVGTAQSRYKDYNIFRDQLKRYVPQDLQTTKLFNTIDNSNYELNDLLWIMKLMNHDTATLEKKPIKNNQVQYFAGAGITYNKYDFGETGSPFIGYTITGGMDIVPKRGLNNIFLRGDLRIGNNHMRSVTEREVLNFFPNYVEKNEYALDMIMFTPTLSIAYSFWKKESSQVYVGIGAGLNITNYSKNVYTTTNKSTNVSKVQNDYLDVKNGWSEYNITAGFVVHKKLEAKLVYRISGTYENYLLIDSKAKTVGLLLIHRF